MQPYDLTQPEIRVDGSGVGLVLKSVENQVVTLCYHIVIKMFIQKYCGTELCMLTFA